MRLRWYEVFGLAFVLVITLPFVAMTAGWALLEKAWKGFKAQHGRHGVLPNPNLQYLAIAGATLFFLGYFVLAARALLR